MNKQQLRKIIKEEIDSVINENIGDIIGYTVLAIILGGNVYLHYFNNMKMFNINTNELNPLVKKILNKVVPNWMKNREIQRIASKLSKIPNVMEFVNDPDKKGIRNELIKYLNDDEMQYLKDMTRQTIKNSSGEIKEIAPSQFIKEKFPSVIDYEIDKRVSDIYWTLKSTEKMDKDSIAWFQASAGYHPAGYGGPNRFNEKILPDGTFEYTWTCYSSSD